MAIISLDSASVSSSIQRILPPNFVTVAIHHFYCVVMRILKTAIFLSFRFCEREALVHRSIPLPFVLRSVTNNKIRNGGQYASRKVL